MTTYEPSEEKMKMKTFILPLGLQKKSWKLSTLV